MAVFPLVIVGGIVALLAALMSRSDDASSAVDERLKACGVDDIVRDAERTQDPAKLLEAASKSAACDPELSAALKKRADGLKVEKGAVTYKSPFPSVSPEAWTAYVNRMKGSNVATVNHSLGMFGFGVRRLVDLGVMKNPRQITNDAGKRVWDAEWSGAWTLPKFLADTAAQYMALAKSSVGHFAQLQREVATGRMPAQITIDGAKVTLSGLLALAHVAGFAGMLSWLKNPKDREKFANTTRVFQRMNGVF